VTTIKLRRNGPYVIEGGDVKVVDWEGREYSPDRLPIALCRCGASSRKPFCDGTHSTLAFHGGPPASGAGDDHA
jgi:3-phenylpropionate/trans-cinnamate dioxygenase ferredoxin subunit